MKLRNMFILIGLLLESITLIAKTVEGPDLPQMNFGTVVQNKIYTIYRSGALYERDLKELRERLDNKKMPFPKTIIYMNYWGYKFPFYGAMEEYKLSQKGAFTFHHSFGASRTYVDGHNPYFPTDDIDEGNHLNSEAQKLFPLMDDGVDGGVKNFLKDLRMVLDPKNQPVLFHCFGGKHRTGMMSMALRYIQGGFWINGPTHKGKNGINYNPAQYEYTLYNKDMYRQENIEFIEQLKDDPEFLKIKAMYASQLQ